MHHLFSISMPPCQKNLNLCMDLFRIGTTSTTGYHILVEENSN